MHTEKMAPEPITRTKTRAAAPPRNGNIFTSPQFFIAAGAELVLARQLPMYFRLALLLIVSAVTALAETRLPLRDGESLTFRVSWAVIPGAGEINISAQNEATSAPQLHVISTTATHGFARVLLQFDAKADSFFDMQSGRLLLFNESSEQRDKKAGHSVTFDYGTGQALYSTIDPAVKPRPLPMPSGEPTDLITCLLQTRTWDLKPGDQRDALVLFDDEFYELTIHALRYEDVSTRLGKFKTLVLEPRMEKTPPKGMFRKGSTVRVWIAQDDDRRLPVKFSVEFKIGTGTATLIKYKPPTSASPAPAASPDAASSNAAGTKTPANSDAKPADQKPAEAGSGTPSATPAPAATTPATDAKNPRP